MVARRRKRAARDPEDRIPSPLGYAASRLLRKAVKAQAVGSDLAGGAGVMLRLS
ncbi:LOW QUALITY PROTEIN: RRP7A isoform 3 [Pan troglodytes]|uniref:RRP7A isoform 3 n=1 Tax=Pan troglodytes TaxID=9598 RepID=A0A2J8LMW7_PANTR|nr:LOW QUALITY PROTEIN: RRP7A isoform 3 [Pan troglodytes]